MEILRIIKPHFGVLIKPLNGKEIRDLNLNGHLISCQEVSKLQTWKRGINAGHVIRDEN